MFTVLHLIMFVAAFVQPTVQDCPMELSTGEISVTWHQIPSGENIESKPLCYNNQTLITRNCTNSVWTPSLKELMPCSKVVKHLEIESCPPGHSKITGNESDYCYHISEPMPWDYPCFASGGSSVITDLGTTEIKYLLDTLKIKNISRYFWLPAQKQNLFSPLLWRVPGPNWGKMVVSSDHLRQEEHLFMNCLLLDTFRSMLVTDFCYKSFPYLCIFKNDLHYSTKCPTDYHYYRFLPESGACYGIAKSDTADGLTFDDFLIEKCRTPMTYNEELNRYIFQKISHINKLTNDTWCWFKARKNKTTKANTTTYEGIINNAGVIGKLDTTFYLSCMACKAEVIHTETELMFEYNCKENVIYLTIYYPSGLWKYGYDDKGIQCFSDAKGFVRAIDVNDIPFINITPLQQNRELGQVEKIVYVIDPVTDHSAQYWCEGHTNNFTFIVTDKIVVNPTGNKIHVFSLVIKYYILPNDDENIIDLSALTDNITDIFDAKQVLLMDVFDYTPNYMFILLHLHIVINDIFNNEALNIQDTYDKLSHICETELVHYNYIFVNLSSSIYCLPTFSMNSIMLNWDMTNIGHIAAPRQFCLQGNGLPVKRRCEGSYKLGGIWGEIEGQCDNTYTPSSTTSFLYSFVKWPASWPICEFLTEGLNFVLCDPEIIIPADIYYLSMSLQQISEIAQTNLSSLDTTDIDNLAWIMDRVMIFDCDYLHLAQTLNSTNVIVDSISDIIEMTSQKKNYETANTFDIAYQIVIKPKFIVQISYPDFNNITGIAVVKSAVSDYFTDSKIYPLYSNTSVEDILSIENLEIATWVPTQMLNSIRLNNGSEEARETLHVTITVYHNGAVFQELQNHSHVINSRIVGVYIPGYISNLVYPIPILFKQLNSTVNSFCGYWDFQPHQLKQTPGSWKKQGCFKVKSINNVTVCECYHLTHFGQLFLNNIFEDQVVLNKSHSVALNVITLVGSFLSLFGIIGIWVTALIFDNWRKKASTKVLLQLSSAISIPLSCIVIFNLDYSMFMKENDKYAIASNKKIPCIILGSLLHFSILASFMWMLITAILQFIRYVRVLGIKRPSRFMIKFTLIGWGIPLVPVIITLALDPYNYIPAPGTYRKICYPSGYYLIAATLIPICIILFVNIGLFVSVLYSISRKSNVHVKTIEMDIVGAQLRVSIFLFFLLGLTWIFGFFSFSNNLIWSYLFCLTSTLQGFVLFIYFVICDPSTRGLWVTLMSPYFHSMSSQSSVTSISAE